MRVVIDHSARRVFLAEERRSRHRQRVLKGAVISFNGGYSTFECLVRNQTEHGVRLSLAESHALPPSFSLSIMKGPARAVAIVWRGHEGVGVRFADAFDDAA